LGARINRDTHQTLWPSVRRLIFLLLFLGWGVCRQPVEISGKENELLINLGQAFAI
jgi:hypothetical protein